jgi:hypothetical protein
MSHVVSDDAFAPIPDVPAFTPKQGGPTRRSCLVKLTPGIGLGVYGWISLAVSKGAAAPTFLRLSARNRLRFRVLTRSENFPGASSFHWERKDERRTQWAKIAARF